MAIEPLTLEKTHQPAWKTKLDYIVETMREMSRQTDPQEMVRAYVRRIQAMLPAERRISLSRRGLSAPQARITRYSEWDAEINPWQNQNRLPILKGGLLGDLIHANEPRIIDHLDLADDDPAHDYLHDIRSIMAIPLYDQGEALNMVVIGKSEPAAFDREQFPEWVWMSNLFGRATHTLVLADELKHAYEKLNLEVEKVGQIQRTLLPDPLPQIPTLDLAAYYQTSHRAGGDYYDCFSLPEGRWGLFVSDVSGHGPTAAVIGAMMHGLGHAYSGPAFPPSELLTFLNTNLVKHYTSRIGAFVTAFYGIYDPANRTMNYSSAGHNPPRLKRCGGGTVAALDRAQSLPMGITEEAIYTDATHTFVPHDQLILYTDGITEAMNGEGAIFGVERLDRVLGSCAETAEDLIGAVIRAVDDFAQGHPADDDRTMIVAKVS
ncbi:MAG TPA: GAF domain-containing SpoIIE family protein phosphatase [Phycisphaerae bacterium]|nr:GAF domain-containing SpoIIE family protein phosphatase [Phycisphaerae bacterium]